MKEKTVKKLFDLNGKTCLITGASGYLGGAIARALAEAGAKVVVTSRELDRAEEVVKRLPDPYEVNHLGAVLDHMDFDGLPDRFQAITDQVNYIDVLINNGHEWCSQNGAEDVRLSDWTDISGEQFTRVLSNATGYFLLSRLVHRQSVEFGQSSSIIMLGSMYGLVSCYPDAYRNICPSVSVSYHTLKGGILQLTRYLATFWAEDSVRVNCLSPGPFPAHGGDHAQGATANQDMVERLEGYSPMRRMGHPTELKGAVVFLASEASSYMTGQNLVIDGGWTAT